MIGQSRPSAIGPIALLRFQQEHRAESVTELRGWQVRKRQLGFGLVEAQRSRASGQRTLGDGSFTVFGRAVTAGTHAGAGNRLLRRELLRSGKSRTAEGGAGTQTDRPLRRMGR